MPHKPFVRFFCALIVSALAMATPLAITVGLLTPAKPSLSAQQTETKSHSAYIPDRGDSLAVLFVGLSPSGESDIFALVHADPANDSLWVLTLPPDCTVEGRFGFDTLSGAYSRGGISEAAAALSQTAGVYIHRSAALSYDSFVKIADASGAVDMLLPVGIDLPEANAHIEAGWQRMTGGRLAAMIQYSEYPGGEAQRLSLAGEAVLKLAQRYLLGFGSQSGERLFAGFISNLSESTLSLPDYEYRRLAFEHLYNIGEIKTIVQVVGWSDTESGRFISKEGLEALREACYPL